MKNIIVSCLVAFTLSISPSANAELINANCSVKFSPNGGARDEIIRRIENARTEILLQAYNFTSKEIVDALIAARKRNIEIIIVVDGKQLNVNGSKIRYAAQNDLHVLLDKKHMIAHNKTIIIDRMWVHTGSYNFSENAETRNAENSIWCESRELSAHYAEEFKEHFLHSVPPTKQDLETCTNPKACYGDN
jgi:phosphatidylserine/phosphatidylglycerophosphate/cardiolipin synthase-like enzyme